MKKPSSFTKNNLASEKKKKIAQMNLRRNPFLAAEVDSQTVWFVKL